MSVAVRIFKMGPPRPKIPKILATSLGSSLYFPLKTANECQLPNKVTAKSLSIKLCNFEKETFQLLIFEMDMEHSVIERCTVKQVMQNSTRMTLTHLFIVLTRHLGVHISIFKKHENNENAATKSSLPLPDTFMSFP